MNEMTECEVLKNSFKMLNYFYEIISDGDNPTRINLKYDLSRRIREEEVLLINSVKQAATKEFFENEILGTKKKIDNPIEKITENVNWNKNHIASFCSCPIIFKDKYRIAEMDEMLAMIVERAKGIIQNWNLETYEYEIDFNDGSLRKFLFLNDEEKTIVIEFGNYVH